MTDDAQTHPTELTDRLEFALRDYVAWNRGTEYPWQGDALLDAEQYSLLCDYLAELPADRIEALIKDLGQ